MQMKLCASIVSLLFLIILIYLHTASQILFAFAYFWAVYKWHHVIWIFPIINFWLKGLWYWLTRLLSLCCFVLRQSLGSRARPAVVAGCVYTSVTKVYFSRFVIYLWKKDLQNKGEYVKNSCTSTAMRIRTEFKNGQRIWIDTSGEKVANRHFRVVIFSCGAEVRILKCHPHREETTGTRSCKMKVNDICIWCMEIWNPSIGLTGCVFPWTLWGFPV